MTNSPTTAASPLARHVKRNVPLLAAILAIAPFAIDAYLPAIPTIAASFGVSASRAESSISIFLIFFALGQLFGGPIADRYGRKSLIFLGSSLFCISTIAIALNNNFAVFLILRGFQAFFGGLAVVGCFAVARDAFSGIQLVKIISLITSIMLMAPTIAPLAGSGILLFAGWRWIFWLIAGYSLLLSLLVLFRLNETLDKSKKPGAVHSSYFRVLGHRQSFLLIVTAALSMTVMFTMLTSSSSTYQEFFGLSEFVYSILFSSNVALIMLLTSLNILLLRRFSVYQLMGFGLSIQLGSSLLLMILSFTPTPLWLFVLLVMITVSSMALVLPNALSELLNEHPHDSGTANALSGLSRFIFGGTIGAIPTFFVYHGFLPMAATMLVASLLAFTCWLLLVADKVQKSPIGTTNTLEL